MDYDELLTAAAATRDAAIVKAEANYQFAVKTIEARKRLQEVRLGLQEYLTPDEIENGFEGFDRAIERANARMDKSGGLLWPGLSQVIIKTSTIFGTFSVDDVMLIIVRDYPDHSSTITRSAISKELSRMSKNGQLQIHQSYAGRKKAFYTAPTLLEAKGS